MKVTVISLPYIFQVLYVLCFTRAQYQVSVYRTIGLLVLYCTCQSVQLAMTEEWKNAFNRDEYPAVILIDLSKPLECLPPIIITVSLTFKELEAEDLSLVTTNLHSGFPTRSDTNRAVQPQKMARGLIFRIKRDWDIVLFI